MAYLTEKRVRLAHKQEVIIMPQQGQPGYAPYQAAAPGTGPSGLGPLAQLLEPSGGGPAPGGTPGADLELSFSSGPALFAGAAARPPGAAGPVPGGVFSYERHAEESAPSPGPIKSQLAMVQAQLEAQQQQLETLTRLLEQRLGGEGAEWQGMARSDSMQGGARRRKGREGEDFD